jgi:DNA-binding transcriptional ArsR family regulator
MVDFHAHPLDRTFAALADPTRRALLARLSEQDGVTISELARPFTMSLPAIMKHLDVLTDAGLISRAKTGRTVACRLTAAPMEEATRWLNRYQRFWTEQLDRLAAFLENEPIQGASAVAATSRAPKSSVPKSSAQRSSAPRSSAPRSSAPRSSAPRSSATRPAPGRTRK